MGKIDSQILNTRPGAYLWELPGKPLAVYLSLDAVDRLLQDVMRGFGAVPRRGAEVGGVLLGRKTRSDRLIYEIEDYELIPIEYKRGPSYLLSESDIEAFGETVAKLSEPGPKAVLGMFRSRTRDAVGLCAEDLYLLNRFFPDPESLVLMIQPYATRVSLAGFYFRENGQFQDGPPLGEFPFRRKDLGGAPAAEAPLPKTPRGIHETPPVRKVPLFDTAPPPPAPPQRPYAEPPPGPAPARQLVPYNYNYSGTTALEPIEEDEVRTVGRSGWVWLPLTFIFLLLGVLLGFQAALSLRPQPATTTDPYTLSLVATKDGENLSVRWDRQAPAIRQAKFGVLVIEDGAYNKTVDLDPSQLQTGSVVYRHSSSDVKFTLEVSLKDRNMIFEKVEWKQ